MCIDDEIKEYVKKRNELLIIFEELDNSELLDKIVELNPWYVPSTPEIAKIGLHKMRLCVPTMPKELVERSKKWLLDRGYSLDIGKGDDK